jgi:hypothetical protein
LSGAADAAGTAAQTLQALLHAASTAPLKAKPRSPFRTFGRRP